MSLTAKVFSNRYEIQRELARGGMAEVYLARDQLLDRPVALKVLYPEYARDPSFVERFRREAQAAANLNHSNIVAVYDWGEEEGTYFIVMEYVEGRSLRDVIRAQGLVPPAQAAEIGAEIAGALAFAHHHGVVHRDVKPGNVLITPTGQVKVTDFGIARAGTSEALTQTGAVMGTATYFSPEQAQGLHVDGRSDVYALGVVLYEMVCGVPPFTGDSPVSVAYKHVREHPLPPARRVPDIPSDLEQIIVTALQKQPEDRYQSADDLRADLLRFHRGRPIAAAPVTAIVSEVSGPTASTVAAAVPTIANVPAAAAPTVAPGRPAPPPPSRPPRRRGAVVAVVVMLVLLAGVIAALLVGQLGDSGSKTIEVPTVTGKQFADAKKTLEGKGFKVERKNVPNDTVAEGQVFAQTPDPGTKLRKGEVVTLQVSAGVGDTKVPDIVGLSAQDGKIKLENAGLKPADPPIFEQSDKPVGTVLRTDPPANKKVKKGSTVAVVLAIQQQVAVPDVADSDEVQAANLLGNNGFVIRKLSEPSETIVEGHVTRTEPTVGTKAARGSTVTMWVSSGPDSAIVPNVFGQTEASARSALQAAGFTNITTLVRPSSAANDGKVINQVPDPGTKWAKSQTVTLQIGQAPASSSTSTSTSSTTSTT